jgi:hypothetical protein
MLSTEFWQGVTLHRTLEHEPAVRRAVVYAFVEADELDARPALSTTNTLLLSSCMGTSFHGASQKCGDYLYAQK